ncbi:MAG: molybdopterin-dependent oxidoreductase [Nocardioides sp.]|uniref:molybdopterin-dependent oxidoreductase n=1 Tax=Nocardioides sp. TaxID=35761 RepID=UPI0039E713BD
MSTTDRPRPAPADTTSRAQPLAGPAAGVVAGWAGLAAGWVTAQLAEAKESPVSAVAEQIIDRLPGPLVEQGIRRLGHHDKQVLVVLVLVVVTLAFALAGRLGRRTPWWPIGIFGGASLLAGLAVARQPGTGGRDELAVVLGFVVSVCGWRFLAIGPAGPAAPRTDPGPPAGADRRFWLRAGLVAAGTAAATAVLPRLGRARRAVESARSRLHIPGLRPAVVPTGADLGLAEPWATPTTSFYRVDIDVTVPYVDPDSWRLRIHGMVDHELELTFAELVARRRTNAWITLNCVSNPVGGDLIGNAWWSGVRLRDLLAEAGVHSGADAVLQTAADGWTCGTPLSALTDDRPAILAVAMNGEALPIAHGFPVRTVVPGLYGYVSACKWVVDLEVTTIDKAVGYWIPLGWAVRGPVKLASRIDRPRSGATVSAGSYRIAGVAWEQEVGVAAVEVSVDGGAWRRTRLARVPSVDTWVQWAVEVDLEPGSHRARVRAVDRDGTVQTSVQRDVAPDGATGWHEVDFTAH